MNTAGPFLPTGPAVRRHAVIVSPVLPVPEIQGNRRVIAELVRWLAARGYRVSYVVQGAVRDPALRTSLAALGAELVAVERAASPRRGRWWRLGRRVALEARRFDRWNRRVLGWQGQVCSWFSGWEERIVHVPNRECWPETVAAVRELVGQGATVVVSEYLYHTPVLEDLPSDVLTLVHTHDCLSQVWEKMGRLGVDTHAREISRGLERRCLRRARVIMALQEDETRTFRALVPETTVVEVGFSPGPLPSASLRVGSEPIVFFPASNNPANRAGLRWLVEEVWPLVRANWPEAQLRVAGEVSKWLGRAPDGVVAVGAVPDLRPEYARAAVVVNPVGVGTGLKIKTVETLALGKALVSTTNGVEGLPGQHPAWRCADGAEDFAAAVVELGREAGRRAALERQALEFAGRHLTRAAVFRGLDEVITRHETKGHS